MTFGARLKELRTQKGMTQEAIARAADISLSNIAKLEQTSSDPSWSTVQKLARVLGVDCRAFAERDEDADKMRPAPGKSRARKSVKKKGGGT